MPRTRAEQLHAQFLRDQYEEIEQFLSIYHGHFPSLHTFHSRTPFDDGCFYISRQASLVDAPALARQASVNSNCLDSLEVGVCELHDLSPVELVGGIIEASRMLQRSQLLAAVNQLTVVDFGGPSTTVTTTFTHPRNEPESVSFGRRVSLTSLSSALSACHVNQFDAKTSSASTCSSCCVRDDGSADSATDLQLSMSTADHRFWADLASTNSSLLMQVHAPQSKAVSKAVLTLDYKSTKILIANDMVCQVFGVDSDQLIGRQLLELISTTPEDDSTASDDAAQPPLIVDRSLLLADQRHRLLPVYGKLMELVNAQSQVVPVSVWSYPIANVAAHQSTSRCPQPIIDETQQPSAEQPKADCRRWLIVLEPVERLTAQCTLGPKGRIFSADESLPEIFGFASPPEMLGTPITRLLPSVQLNKCPSDASVSTCGVSKSHGTFPLNVTIKPDIDDSEPNMEPLKYELNITIYQNVSGVITLLENGSVHSYNPTFVNTLLGYNSDQLRCHPIAEIIPKFFADMETVIDDDEMPLPPLDGSDFDATIHSIDGLSLNEALRPKSSLPSTAEENDVNEKKMAASLNGTSPMPNMPPETPSPVSARTIQSGEETVFTKFATSTPTGGRVKQPLIREGTYTGYARHRDDCLIAIWYQVKKIVLKDHTVLYSVWIHRDHSWCHSSGSSQHNNTTSSDLSLTGTSSESQLSSFRPIKIKPFSRAGLSSTGSSRHSTESSGPSMTIGTGSSTHAPNMPPGPQRSDSLLATKPSTTPKANAHILNSMASTSNDTRCSSNQTVTSQAMAGDYSLKYRHLVQIGKGAFGAVSLGARNNDGLLVVSKFIKKDKVLVDSWETLEGGKRVPIEVHLLRTIKHPNIVEVVEICENQSFYQLVMEKHGPGMDLFEFIDRRPLLDEKLASYIFRQVVSAVSYLNSMSIVHRDLKDENVIINENFHCKLIDFGSAAYFRANKQFSTFCGTVEYCSPEVLSGNKYTGPELEIWSLGILLFTLIFGENPFCTVEETIRADLEFPSHVAVSESCASLIGWMLHAHVSARCTIAELQQHWWLTQRININNYCWPRVLQHLEAYEVHPPKYLTDLSDKERDLLLGSAGPSVKWSTSTPS